MIYQIGTDADNNPINLTLELLNGSLIIKDQDMNIIGQTIGNPTINCNPDNTPFVDIDEAYQWFLSSKYSRQINQETE